MIVLDAAAVLDLLLRDPPGRWVQAWLSADPDAATPHLCDVEVTSALRRRERQGSVEPRRAERALTRLQALPVERLPMRPLLRAIWSHRANLTAYDAAYVALAEHLGATLVTTDLRLARAPGIAARVVTHVT